MKPSRKLVRGVRLQVWIILSLLLVFLGAHVVLVIERGNLLLEVRAAQEATRKCLEIMEERQ